MPRKLPWVKTVSPAVVSRPKTLSSTAKPPKKRVKISPPAPDTDDEEEASEPTRSKQPTDRAPSTSPPPEPPPECFMREGIDHDDKYRMVEDEFLSVAQQFTVHLHAAEYKKQQRMVKARNADAINSILRPVTGKMPDQTKRKVQSLAKSKAQRKLMDGLLGKKSGEADDSDSDVNLPYVGTTLHGLMDASRGKSAPMVKIRPIATATRAAAGFHMTTAQSKSFRSSFTESPDSKSILRPGLPIQKNEESTESSDGDDDLDAPVRPMKSSSFDQKLASVQSKPAISFPISSSSEVSQPSIFARPRMMPSSTGSLTSGAKVDLEPERPSIKADSSEEEKMSRVARRLKYSRSQGVKQEAEEEQKKSLDVIPTFM